MFYTHNKHETRIGATVLFFPLTPCSSQWTPRTLYCARVQAVARRFWRWAFFPYLLPWLLYHAFADEAATTFVHAISICVSASRDAGSCAAAPAGRGELRETIPGLACTRFTESGEHECDARARAFSENVLKGTSGLLFLSTVVPNAFFFSVARQRYEFCLTPRC